MISAKLGETKEIEKTGASMNRHISAGDLTEHRKSATRPAPTGHRRHDKMCKSQNNESKKLKDKVNKKDGWKKNGRQNKKNQSRRIHNVAGSPGSSSAQFAHFQAQCAFYARVRSALQHRPPSMQRGLG